MRTTLNGTQITGFFGQNVGNGNRWLFVNGTSSKTRRNSYAVALIDSDGQAVVKMEPRQQLGEFTNEQVVSALLTA